MLRHLWALDIAARHSLTILSHEYRQWFLVFSTLVSSKSTSVGCPIKHGGSFHRFLYVYQREIHCPYLVNYQYLDSSQAPWWLDEWDDMTWHDSFFTVDQWRLIVIIDSTVVILHISDDACEWSCPSVLAFVPDKGTACSCEEWGVSSSSMNRGTWCRHRLCVGEIPTVE
jgi:hypothetical protein